MSRTIKIILTDKDYARIHEVYPNIEQAVREFLGCTETIVTDREFAVEKISSYTTGTHFSYRDVFNNDPECMNTAHAKLVRSVCRDHGLAVCVGYDELSKVKIYERTEENLV